MLLAAVITGAATVLMLQDERGIWFRDGSGVLQDQLADIERAISRPTSGEIGGHLLQEQGLHVIEALPLGNPSHHVAGVLGVLSPIPITLSKAQRGGLDRVIEHIQTILEMDHQQRESRPLDPYPASFVPGLIHELGSYLFGISATLDAFEARFAEQDLVAKYGANIRTSLDRMSAFVTELREYQDPRGLSWSTQDFESLLQQVIEQLQPNAANLSVDLRLHTDGCLTTVDVDGQGLHMALVNVIDFALRQETAGSQLTIHTSTNRQDNRGTVSGYLDCSNWKFNNVDPTRLFEPFYFRASGLGRLTLPGARRVFESLSGSLTAGPGPGGGLRISFTLPSVVA